LKCRRGYLRYDLGSLLAFNGLRRQGFHGSSRHQEAQPQNQVIFSGIQPTGIPHIGNYLGALQQWVHLQNNAAPGTKLLYSIVDLHAITIAQDPAQLKRWKRELMGVLLAVGLSPEKGAVLFYQSSVC
jgi:tryptophanyl-tRNA synthetase